MTVMMAVALVMMPMAFMAVMPCTPRSRYGTGGREG